jgi:Partial alpha/beta-hydrolase lipase region
MRCSACNALAIWLLLTCVPGALSLRKHPLGVQVDASHAKRGRNGIANSLRLPSWPKWPPDISGLVLKWGYPFEEDWVKTEDGYKLEVFRLPHYGRPEHPATPVLLMHGLLVRIYERVMTSCP